MTRIFAILLAVSCAYGAYHFTLQRGFVNPYPAVCDLVAERIFLDDSKIKNWKKTCSRRSRLVTPYSPKKLIIKDMNNALALLKVSHLEVYDSSEVASIWRGESLETGIESRFVDGELVIYKIHPDSPAQEAGLKPGDVIQSINAEQPNPWEAQTEQGSYLMLRQDKEFSVKIKPRSIQRSEDLNLEIKSAQKAVLEIPSFRATFFEEEKLKTLQQQIAPLSKLVVDLRGNPGGNFVAGLRFLSLFMCKAEEVGRLVKPRAPVKTPAELPNDLRDQEQLAVLDNSSEILLKTYDNPQCFKGEVRVLVDGKSSSVAEMVAQALKEFKKAPLLGSPSRGQLLVGVWYPLDEVGPGVQISIPEAIYLSHKQHQIEGQGVALDRVLYYSLPEMQAGIDSWVKKALD
ncbi:S41 family peptidase [Bdellovibrio bacteriovorus]|uniref:Carboxy-terminal processing protease n=1 Tax=Bdellovibrio bacteriovorus (strain ATCC 15356 / DSM 50701 / NCIMB 9529 / HD100) TaxID=264462 RepID=Q6MNK9_BDEBA|nr:S41 family peptidase [Bdellovibrio bacteriovorus]CAE79142.1 carboxy-terminal processing protease [Bdellovibrio bacteriovorus HD100]